MPEPSNEQSSSEQPTEPIRPLGEPTRQYTTPVPTSGDSTVSPRAARPARLPIILASVGLAAAAILAVVVVVLLMQRAEVPVATPSTSPSTPAAPPAAPAEPAPAPPAAPVVVPPSRSPGPNECVDSTGEGGAMDLESARVEVHDGDLFVVLELTQALPAGNSGVGIYAEPANGRRSYQLATLWQDGVLDEYFVHEFSRDDNEGLDGDDVRVDGSTVAFAVPGDVFDRLGDEWRWYAYSTAAGVDVDACPGDPLTFETVEFERPED